MHIGDVIVQIGLSGESLDAVRACDFSLTLFGCRLFVFATHSIFSVRVQRLSTAEMTSAMLADGIFRRPPHVDK